MPSFNQRGFFSNYITPNRFGVDDENPEYTKQQEVQTSPKSDFGPILHTKSYRTDDGRRKRKVLPRNIRRHENSDNSSWTSSITHLTKRSRISKKEESKPKPSEKSDSEDDSLSAIIEENPEYKSRLEKLRRKEEEK